MLSGAVDRSSSDDNAIRYVLPVLLMTSRFPVGLMDPMACGTGSIYVGAVNAQRIPRLAPQFDLVVVYNVGKLHTGGGAKSAHYGCFVVITRPHRSIS